MPLWNVYYPEGAYTVEDKQEFAERITGIYTKYNLPAFYVSVMFHELPADTFYVGGEEASGYIRIWVDHIARRMPDEMSRWWMDQVNELIAPFTAERGHRWELHIDNTPMSINVEQIAGTLLVQHYVPEVLEPHHCVLVSETDVITPRGRTTIQITWELSAQADGDGRCIYTNTVSAHATDEYFSFLDEQG